MNKKFKYSMNILSTFMLLSLFPTSVKLILATSEQGYGHYTSVRIYNQMKDGSNITIHCKSKDDDLGDHEVQVGSPYEWRFKVNFWRTTLFYCNSYWKGKHIGFNAYDAKRDAERCEWACVWKAFEDGLYGYVEDPRVPDLHYVWK